MYLTIKEVQDKYKVSRQTVYNWFDSGLKFIKLGKSVRIDEQELDNWIEQLQKK